VFEYLELYLAKSQEFKINSIWSESMKNTNSTSKTEIDSKNSKKLVFESTIELMPLIGSIACCLSPLLLSTDKYTLILTFILLIISSLLVSAKMKFYPDYMIRSRYLFGIPIKSPKTPYLNVNKIEVKMIETPLDPQGLPGVPLVIIHRSNKRNVFLEAYNSFGFKDFTDIEPLVFFLIQNYRDRVEINVSKKLYPEAFKSVQKMISVPVMNLPD